MTVMSVANVHSVASGYGAVHMQRQLIPSTVLHGQEMDMAAQSAAALLANKDGQHQAQSVAATNAENRTHQFDKHAARSGSFAMGTGHASGSSTMEADADAGGPPEQARQDLPQLGATVDVYL